MVARARITVRLTDEEWEALKTGAQVERRDPRDQVGLWMRRALEDAGVLVPVTTSRYDRRPDETRRRALRGRHVPYYGARLGV